ncbi:uncharacterized protein N7483_009042 [Penicillium malachiteum]|uniref:uncharacterized protein n=1 Tax=Penicillium malachiteum TaxID=1324776 RepID=UPI002548E341|nr:uncharacterized protein N7483_009042 [Penicillium malachiteum]KAJ5721108.1 hypothetical protein N7483_009042 [Penicillium malachiteum]
MASDSAATTRRLWSKLEDGRLVSLVQRFGDQRGKEVGVENQANGNQDCRKRWFHSLDPALRKGRWSKEEDELLLAAYKQLGPAWKDIALLIEGRKDDQCAKRYNDILNPLAKDRLKNWSPQEDQYLAAKVQELGHKWAAISAGLPGRPPLTCRNRWRRLSKDLLKQPEEPFNTPTPALGPDSQSIADSFPTDLSLYSVDPDGLNDPQSLDISTDLSLGLLPDNTLLSPVYGMDTMSIQSGSVYGMDNINLHNTPRPDMTHGLPDSGFSFQQLEELYESASEGPSFALPDRNYESEPNMLTDFSISNLMNTHTHTRPRYSWQINDGNYLYNIASLDLANTHPRVRPNPPRSLQTRMPGPGTSLVIPEVDEESDPLLEQAAVRQVFSNDSMGGDLVAGAGPGPGVVQHHHHFHHHHYHHHYHH